MPVFDVDNNSLRAKLSNSFPDFAILELEEYVEQNYPSAMDLLRYPVSRNTPLYGFGHPTGMPMLYVPGGRVIEEISSGYSNEDNQAIRQ
jgi:hypothetical protein